MKLMEIYFDEFLETQKTNYELLSESSQETIQKFKLFFDLQQKLFNNHLFGVFDPYYELEDYEKVIMQCYIKASHLIFSVHELTLRGDYGSARILMRQIFEYLVLGKFVQTTKNNGVTKSWLNNSEFDVYKNIIKFLKEPDKKNLHEFWIMLCKLAHAGTTSSQIVHDPEIIHEQIIITYKLNMIFLCCKNIFLQKSFINRRLKYRSEKYELEKKENKEIKKQLTILEKEYFELFSESGISMIKDYRMHWEFKKIVNK